MGKLSHDPCIQHSTHPHQLHLNLPNPPIQCSGCNLSSNGWMYSCIPCNFSLHLSCAQMPNLITHPSHPFHPLTLLPSPIYPSGFFNCDACSRPGYAFSYHCTHCDFDVHITCASKPISITHQSHPHELQLAFKSPYQTNGFSCDICCKIGGSHWLYRCGGCEFDAHLECATSVSQIHLQNRSNSFPVQNSFQTPKGNAYMHSQSMNSMQNYHQLNRQNSLQQIGQNYQHPNAQNFQYATTQNYRQPNQQNYQQPAAGQNYQQQNGQNTTMTDTIIQGIFEGASQQIGQTLVQSIIGGGDNGGGTGGGGGGDDGGDTYL